MQFEVPPSAARISLPRAEPTVDPLSCFKAKARLGEFFDGECEEIVARLFDGAVHVARGEHLLREGDECSAIFVLCSGWAARYVHLAEGGRQIVELLLPGDMFPVHAMIASDMDDGIMALNSCVAATCSPAALEAAVLGNTNFTRTLWWLTRREKGILRAWIANLGQLNAYARVAHLICEISARLAQAGLVHDGHFEVPLTQEDLADANGVTGVHANRTLRQLSRDGLLELRHKRARIMDEDGLQRAAGFDGAYLNPG